MVTLESEKGGVIMGSEYRAGALDWTVPPAGGPDPSPDAPRPGAARDADAPTEPGAAVGPPATPRAPHRDTSSLTAGAAAAAVGTLPAGGASAVGPASAPPLPHPGAPSPAAGGGAHLPRSGDGSLTTAGEAAGSSTRAPSRATSNWSSGGGIPSNLQMDLTPIPVPSPAPAPPAPPASHPGAPQAARGGISGLSIPVTLPAYPSGRTPAPVPVSPPGNTVPEFLYQLTKMLTDDNRHCIEWSNGRIEVHNPPKLASDVLHRYFRHSKYASFQRQLNYFGFRKLAGKGKMAPCSYVNEAVSSDLRSLLTIKRKTSVSTKDKAGPTGRTGESSSLSSNGAAPAAGSAKDARGVTVTPPADPVLAGIAADMYGNERMRLDAAGVVVPPAYGVAVGRGVRHSMNGYGGRASALGDRTGTAESAVGGGVGRGGADVPPSVRAVSGAAPMPAPPSALSDAVRLGAEMDPLRQLEKNYRATLKELDVAEERERGGSSGEEGEKKDGSVDEEIENGTGDGETNASCPPLFEGSIFSRNSSLVDLAMLPTLEEMNDAIGDDDDLGGGGGGSGGGMGFVDFPHEELDPSNTKIDGS